MFQPLPTPDEMAGWDRQAMDRFGIRPEILMENAARAAVDVLLSEVDCRGASVLILAGPGNNGGDGFAMARRLKDLGASTLVVHTRPKKSYRGETRYHLDLARRTGVPMQLLSRFDLSAHPRPDVIVDALLGTGFSGQLRPDMLDLVKSINSLGCFTLAVDCPTGLDGLTGLPAPEAVRADMTATMHAVKLGMALPRAREYTGRVRVCEIGIPAQVSMRGRASHQRITRRIMELVPVSEQDVHKGTSGHVLVIGGSISETGDLTGAPHLAGLGALRSGAGLVTLAAPGDLSPNLKHGCPDLMTLPLKTGNQWTADMVNPLMPLLGRFDSVVIGPGLGRSSGARAFLAALLPVLSETGIPCVLDADGLHHLSSMPEATPKSAILTPHPGEMAKLLGTDTRTIQKNRFGAARKLAEKTNATALLKGAGTVVCGPGSPHCLSPFAAPNLAVAGSGDVLAGLLGALLARSIAPLPGACIGVYWHGLAGKILAQEFPRRGNLASEIAQALPTALKEATCAPHET